MTDFEAFKEFLDKYKGRLSYYIDGRGAMNYIIINNPVRPINLVFCFHEGKFICPDAERERG